MNIKGTRPQHITTGGFHNPDLHKRCTAMSKRSGKRCGGPAVLNSANQKCRMHGGHGHHQIGPLDASFKHGRYSKYLPAQLDKLYTEALSNPELLEMADHIALLEARMQEVLGTQATGDPAPKWSEVAEAFAAFETELLSGDMEKAVPALEAIHRLLEAGDKWDRTWNTVVDTMEQLRKMTDTEVKRKKELNQMVPVERVVILMAAVGNAVKRHVTNPEEIQAVYRELAALHHSEDTAGGIPLVGPEVVDVSPRVTGRAREEQRKLKISQAEA